MLLNMVSVVDSWGKLWTALSNTEACTGSIIVSFCLCWVQNATAFSTAYSTTGPKQTSVSGRRPPYMAMENAWLNSGSHLLQSPLLGSGPSDRRVQLWDSWLYKRQLESCENCLFKEQQAPDKNL